MTWPQNYHWRRKYHIQFYHKLPLCTALQSAHILRGTPSIVILGSWCGCHDYKQWLHKWIQPLRNGFEFPLGTRPFQVDLHSLLKSWLSVRFVVTAEHFITFKFRSKLFHNSNALSIASQTLYHKPSRLSRSDLIAASTPSPLGCHNADSKRRSSWFASYCAILRFYSVVAAHMPST